jgi:hypothetical protein
VELQAQQARDACRVHGACAHATRTDLGGEVHDLDVGEGVVGDGLVHPGQCRAEQRMSACPIHKSESEDYRLYFSILALKSCMA